MNNNNIIVQTQQSNTQNKNPNSIVNNTYSQISWSVCLSLDKLIRAITWIRNHKSNWIKWKMGRANKAELKNNNNSRIARHSI